MIEDARRFARRRDGAVWEESLSFRPDHDVDRFAITRSQARQNVAALLVRTPYQLSLDTLKRPFPVRDMREMALEAWEPGDFHFRVEPWLMGLMGFIS